MHRWTRDEQLERTVAVGTKLAEPGAHYAYTDANYLLLTEVIEGRTGKPFTQAMRELLCYDAMGYSHTLDAHLGTHACRNVAAGTPLLG
ncbi:MAG: serine hydrolase [Flavobacteriales bacterium]|nr:serine hydrolase [Flavobacteriales bacterium]